MTAKIKNLQNALQLILLSAPILKLMCDRTSNGTVVSNELSIVDKTTVNCENETKDDKKEEYRDVNAVEKKLEPIEDRSDEASEEQELLELVEARFQFILKSLIKHCSGSAK